MKWTIVLLAVFIVGCEESSNESAIPSGTGFAGMWSHDDIGTEGQWCSKIGGAWACSPAPGTLPACAGTNVGMQFTVIDAYQMQTGLGLQSYSIENDVMTLIPANQTIGIEFLDDFQTSAVLTFADGCSLKYRRFE